MKFAAAEFHVLKCDVGARGCGRCAGCHIAAHERSSVGGGNMWSHGAAAEMEPMAIASGGAGPQVDAEAAVREHARKHRGLRRQLDEMTGARCCCVPAGRYETCALDVCCSPVLCCSLFFVLSCVMLILFIVVAIKQPDAIVAMAAARPSATERLAREAALVDDAVNWCSLPIRMLATPPSCGRVVMIGLNGTGANYLRPRLEAATRVTTATTGCSPTRRAYVAPGDCTGLSFAANDLAVLFADWDDVVATPHYDATHAVFVLRNPLAAAVEAFLEDHVDDDFRGQAWPLYAMAYADAFVDAVQDSNKPLGDGVARIVVDHSEFPNAHDTVGRVIDFLRPVFRTNFPTGNERMVRCIDAAGLYDKPVATTVSAAFQSERLYKDFCARVKHVWQADKWGKECE